MSGGDTHSDIPERYRRHLEDGWIAVDFDGTLAEYHGWDAALKFGAPIPAMVDRVKQWIAWGIEVRIMTARIPESYTATFKCEVEGYWWNRWDMEKALGDWTEEHCGKRLTCTCVKDLHMIELWDDRAIQVVTNTGRSLAEEHAAELAALRGAP